MELWRKPATAEWYYDSAQWVDDVDVSAEAWSGTKYFYLDGTKDKNGRRHTELRLDLTEAEVENLYRGLLKGRKKELRRLTLFERRVGKLISAIRTKLYAASYGSEEEKILKSVLDKLREL